MKEVINMYKKPTLDLGEEHGGIMLMMQIMKKIAIRLLDGKEVRREDLSKVVEFLVNFADKCHHGKEEDIFFPKLVKTTSNKKLVNMLVGEHKTGRDFIRGIVESFKKYKAGNPDAIHIAVNIEGYVQLLTEHIRKENTILFPIADKELPTKIQEKMAKEFERFEKNVIGAGKHEEFHGWLKELSQTY